MRSALVRVTCALASAGAIAWSDQGGRSVDLPPPQSASPGAADAGADAPQNEPVVQLQIMPGATHSGFDGVHAFRVPVAIYGSADATLAASDPTMVAIASAQLVDTSQDNGKYFLVTAKKPGMVTLTASAHGRTVSATLTIAAYTPDEWTTGEQRYLNAASSGPPCVQCHSSNGGISLAVADGIGGGRRHRERDHDRRARRRESDHAGAPQMGGERHRGQGARRVLAWARAARLRRLDVGRHSVDVSVSTPRRTRPARVAVVALTITCCVATWTSRKCRWSGLFV